MAFGRNKYPNNQGFNPQNPGMTQNPYMIESQIQRLYYEMESMNKKLNNLNRRVKRIENYLQLRNEEINDEDF